jgi:endonuclease/exonuclease/phosphatase family metal-dependent hydrolase
MIRILIAIPLLLSSLTLPTQAARSIKVASYNVKNLFDGILDNPHNPKEKAKPARELRAMAQVMRQLNADVIVMQEVESESTLRKFRDQYLKDSGYQTIHVHEGNDLRGIDVALMSRWPVTAIQSHRQVTFQAGEYRRKFSRDLLQAEILTPENYRFTVFAAHLKSKIGGAQSDLIRAAEANAIQQIILNFQRQYPEKNFLIAGDFNDTPDAEALSPLLHPHNPAGLKDLAALELGVGSAVFSYHPRKYRSRIDYILTAPAMQPEYIPRSLHILKSKEAFEASDHLPLVAEFIPRER